MALSREGHADQTSRLTNSKYPPSGKTHEACQPFGAAQPVNAPVLGVEHDDGRQRERLSPVTVDVFEPKLELFLGGADVVAAGHRTRDAQPAGC